jgi:hypothetical protein
LALRPPRFSPEARVSAWSSDPEQQINRLQRSIVMFAKINLAAVAAGAMRAALFACALVVVAGTAHAQQKPSPAAIKIAREILDLKNTASLFGQMVPSVIDKVKGMLVQTNIMLRKDLDEVGANLNKVYAPRTNELLNEFSVVYASRFTEAELKEIVTFYRSPTGKKVILLEPQIFDDAVTNLQDWQEKFAEEVIRAFRAEMKKRGHDL